MHSSMLEINDMSKLGSMMTNKMSVTDVHLVKKLDKSFKRHAKTSSMHQRTVS
jgi:hypothetical protein